ncbi:MAG: alpha/beta hydrolase [Actinobacteria bacterium]|nr:alpha/beta hydrolase [Actinomycetota bacterium]
MTRIGAQVLVASLLLASCSSNSEFVVQTIPTPTTVVAPPPSTTPIASTTSSTTSTACDHPDPTITNHVYASYPDINERFTSFDLHLPAGCGPFPVLVWVHGGAWLGGDKANPESIDRAKYAASLGYALVSTNYRLANKFGQGTWPDYPNDVADAIAHIVGNASSLRLDAEHISLLGHSAGGHTVAIVSADPMYLASRDLAPDTIDCVVANDTEGYRLDDRNTAYPEAIENAFGTDPSVLADASPSVGIERHGAPSTRYLVVTRGSARRQEVASEFVELIKVAGGDARLFIAGDYSHSEVNLALGEPGGSPFVPRVRRATA